MRTMCNFEGCGRPEWSKGWCSAHYAQSRKGVALKPVKKQKNAASRAWCAFENCGKVETLAGLCAGHYKQKKLGQPLSPLKVMDGTQGCAFPDCENPHQSHGYCATHNSQKRRKGYMSPAKAPNQGCLTKNCSGDHFSKGYCRRCYVKDRRITSSKIKENEQRRRFRLRGLESDAGITVQALRNRDGNFCFFCGTQMQFDSWDSTYSKGNRNDSYATHEHLIPLSRGGPNTWWNSTLACWRCNRFKRDKTVSEFLEGLDTQEGSVVTSVEQMKEHVIGSESVSDDVKHIVSDLLDFAQE